MLVIHARSIVNRCHTLRPSRFRLCRIAIGVAALGACTTAPSLAQRGGGGNPFAPPAATYHYARAHDFHVVNMLLNIHIQWTTRGLAGTVINTIEPLRDKLPTVQFDAGPALTVSQCKINGNRAPFEHVGDKLTIHPPAPLKLGVPVKVEIAYVLDHSKQRFGLIGPSGVHWVEQQANQPDRRPAIWTQGESEENHYWVPCYDYPNDKCTSETYVEVPANWYMIGNGKLIDIQNNPTRNSRTFHWKMIQPHSSYLLSLAGGEMDVVRDSWRGVDLFYCVPKGQGKLVEASFGHTRDMLSFFSDTLGVKYAWPKYAQTAMYDFGGGMENVSATTLGSFSLIHPKDSKWGVMSLTSHELSHQWFGDLVTCNDWGNIWLNEGFATFMETLYLEHVGGKDVYDRERNNNLRAYLGESRQYKRPIVTDLYANPDVMFDSHTYPKGGLILHMLRRKLGDADFFRGLGYYLKKHEYGNVDTDDLVQALEQSTGRSVQQFFNQWVYKPGHPVLGYTWTYDAGARAVTLNVEQQQDTTGGTPIYDMDLPVALIINGYLTRSTLHLNLDKQTFTIPASDSPQGILIDPDHDLILEQKGPDRSALENKAILTLAPCYVDRQAAAMNLINDNPSDDTVRAVVREAAGDSSDDLAATVVRRAGGLKKPYLRADFEAMLKSKGEQTRAAAAAALGQLPADQHDIALLKALVNGNEQSSVVAAALESLGSVDVDGSMDTIKKGLTIDSGFDRVRNGALVAIANSKSPAAANIVIGEAETGPTRTKFNAIGLLGSNYLGNARAEAALIAMLKNNDVFIVRAVIRSLEQRKDPLAVPALHDLANSSKDKDVVDAAKAAAQSLSPGGA